LKRPMAKIELILGLARCAFLTCAEKEFLAGNLDNLESLTVLSIEDICLKVGRFINTRCWKPEILADQVQRDLETMQKYRISWVSILSEDYPPLLRELHDAPFVVFWRGNLPDPERPLAAIVGTRSPSGNGALAAARLGREFAEAGIPVVSGLANGIDTFAHRGNVDGGGASVAILACGVEQIYPRSNVCLARRMLETGGCLMSEYAPAELPLQYRFPQRNRIISGLARAVVIVEAPEKSGALITADFALEQGRDLYVCKATLDSSRNAGVRRIYGQGAPAIGSAGEILEAWGYPAKPASGADPRRAAGSERTVTENDLTFSASIGRQLALDFRNELARHENKGY